MMVFSNSISYFHKKIILVFEGLFIEKIGHRVR